MQRRTLLQWIAAASGAPSAPASPRLCAQPRELTPEAIALLHDIAPTVLPAALGAAGVSGVVDSSSPGRAATGKASRCRMATAIRG